MIFQPDNLIKAKAVQVQGKKVDKMAIAFVLITFGVEQSHVGSAPWSYTKDATAYNGDLFQVMKIMNMNNIENINREGKKPTIFFGAIMR